MKKILGIHKYALKILQFMQNSKQTHVYHVL